MTNDELFDGSNAHLMTHVVPTNDLREHITDGQCWCNPEVDDDLVVIHNSMDERETYEEGRKEAAMKTIDLLTFGGEEVKCVRACDHNKAMLLLAKLRDGRHYPKGGYASDVTAEWDALLDEWFGEVRPDFDP